MVQLAERVPADLAAQSCPYEARFLSPREVRELSRSRPDLYSFEFAERALAKGDRCFGILSHGHLISFGWYSTRPTEAHDGIEVHFDPDYFYGYHAHTVPEHRGEGLHPLLKVRAVQQGALDGRKGSVAYVEAENVPMLIASRRVGAVTFGTVWQLRIGRRTWLLHSPGCRRYGFRFRR